MMCLSVVILRVQAMTRIAPVYNVVWRSQVVRSNTRIHPTPASNVVSAAPASAEPPRISIQSTFIVILLALGYHEFRAGCSS